MVGSEKKHLFMDMIKDAFSYIPTLISSAIFPPIAEGAEMVMRTIEERMLHLEKRIVRRACSLLTIGFGGVFLIFALFFFLIEYLSWSKTASFFSLGITIFVIGLLLKVFESDR